MKAKKVICLFLLVICFTLASQSWGQAPTLDFETKANTRFSQEYWVTDPYLGGTLQTALSFLGSTICKLHCNQPQTLTANLTIPANITFAPDPGCLISIPSGQTLTINGPIQAGLYQIFSDSNSGLNGVVLGPNVADRIYPQWWGAKADNTTDDTAAIQACFNAIASVPQHSGQPVMGLIGNYKTTSTLNFKNCQDLHIKGDRDYASAINGVGVSGPVINWGGSNVFTVDDVLFTCDANSDALMYFYRTTTNAQGGPFYFNRCRFNGYPKIVLMYAIGMEVVEFRTCSAATGTDTVCYLSTDTNSLGVSLPDLNTGYIPPSTGSNCTELFDGGTWYSISSSATSASSIFKFEGGTGYQIKNIFFYNAIGSGAPCIWVACDSVTALSVIDCRQEGATSTAPFLSVTKGGLGGLRYENNAIQSATVGIKVASGLTLANSMIAGNGGGNCTAYSLNYVQNCTIIDPTYTLTVGDATLGSISSSHVEVNSITYNPGAANGQTGPCFIKLVGAGSSTFDVGNAGSGYLGLTINNANGYGGFLNFTNNIPGSSQDIAKISGSSTGPSNHLDFYLGDSLYVRLNTTGLSILTGANPTSPLQTALLPVYANNAAAKAGGLTAGAFYRTNADPDPVCQVH